MVTDDDVEEITRRCCVGGPSASTYFLIVLLWIPSSRSIARSDIPLRLAFRIAFHRSFWRNVGLRAEAAASLLAVATSSIIILGPLPSSARECSGSRVSIQRSPKPSTPEVGTVTLAERPWPFRRNTGLRGASWAARIALHAAPTTGRPVLSGPPQPPLRSWDVPALAATGVCRWNFTVLSLATLLRCLKHRICSRHSSGSSGRNAGWSYAWNRSCVSTAGGSRDNTVKFQRHTLQLLPDRHRRSYAGQEQLQGVPLEPPALATLLRCLKHRICSRHSSSQRSDRWTRSYAWNRSCVSNTAGGWPGTTR